MDTINITPQQAVLYAAIMNAGIGLILGLCPLIFGFLKKNVKYGVLGFVSAIVGGAILGILLSIPAAAIFTWLIVRGSKTPTQPDDPTN